MLVSIRNWKRLNRSRKISFLMSVFLIIAGLLVSMMTFLAYLSIESFCYNIAIPNDSPELKINCSNMERNSLKVPYKISNKGHYDIVEVKIKLSICICYFKNNSNEEIRRIIFSKKFNLNTIRPGEEIADVFRGDHLDFDNLEIIHFLDELEIHKEIKRLMNIQIFASLSGLAQLHIELEDIDIDGDRY